MNDIVKLFRYGNKIVVIRQDDLALDPREMFDNIGIFWAWHRRYRMGDEDVTRKGRRFSKDEFDPSNFDSMNEIADAIYKRAQAVLVQLVYMYDHSGQSVSIVPFNDRWDSGTLGVIWFPKENLGDIGYKRCTKGAIHRAEQVLKEEIKTYDAYLRGEVYGYTVYAVGKDIRGPSDESCWGYYGVDAIGTMLDDALGSVGAASAKEITLQEAQDLRAA